MTAKDVESYISATPSAIQGKLRVIRATIQSAAPKATEGISYQIPCYTYKGPLVFFGLQKRHIGLYLRPPLIENHRTELKHYSTTKSAIHLPLDEEVPVQLIKKLVRAAIKKNEGEQKGD